MLKIHRLIVVEGHCCYRSSSTALRGFLEDDRDILGDRIDWEVRGWIDVSDVSMSRRRSSRPHEYHRTLRADESCIASRLCELQMGEHNF